MQLMLCNCFINPSALIEHKPSCQGEKPLEVVNDVVHHIFSYLPVEQLLFNKRVCRNFKVLTEKHLHQCKGRELLEVMAFFLKNNAISQLLFLIPTFEFDRTFEFQGQKYSLSIILKKFWFQKEPSLNVVLKCQMICSVFSLELFYQDMISQDFECEDLQDFIWIEALEDKAKVRLKSCLMLMLASFPSEFFIKGNKNRNATDFKTIRIYVRLIVLLKQVEDNPCQNRFLDRVFLNSLLHTLINQGYLHSAVELAQNHTDTLYNLCVAKRELFSQTSAKTPLLCEIVSCQNRFLGQNYTDRSLNEIVTEKDLLSFLRPINEVDRQEVSAIDSWVELLNQLDQWPKGLDKLFLNLIQNCLDSDSFTTSDRKPYSLIAMHAAKWLFSCPSKIDKGINLYVDILNLFKNSTFSNKKWPSLFQTVPFIYREKVIWKFLSPLLKKGYFQYYDRKNQTNYISYLKDSHVKLLYQQLSIFQDFENIQELYRQLDPVKRVEKLLEIQSLALKLERLYQKIVPSKRPFIEDHLYQLLKLVNLDEKEQILSCLSLSFIESLSVARGHNIEFVKKTINSLDAFKDEYEAISHLFLEDP